MTFVDDAICLEQFNSFISNLNSNAAVIDNKKQINKITVKEMKNTKINK